jgi:hypothetical protein
MKGRPLRYHPPKNGNKMSLSSLSPEQLVILSKASAKEAKSATPAAGLYTVDPFTVTLGGELLVSEDEQYIPTTSVPLLATMVVALHRAGFQRDGIRDLIIQSAKDAMNKGNAVGDEMETTVAYMKTELKDLQLALASGLPSKSRKGKARLNRAEWSVE